jgi:secreted trypsin-like serine protease
MWQKLRFCGLVGLIGLLISCVSDNLKAPSLEGTLYNDANANGQQDAGETGLSGWTVYLDANNNAALDTGELSAQSDAQGEYSFTQITPDSYRVRQVMPFGWRNVSGGDAATLEARLSSAAAPYGGKQPFKGPKIVGGVDADVSDYPFIAAIGGIDQAGDFNQFCGGTLISDTWILTASHCSVDNEGVVLDASAISLAARLGSSDRTTGGQLVEISRVILHPNYDAIGLDGEPGTEDDGPPTGYDIALWELARPVNLRGDLYTLEMLTPQLEALTADNTLATAIGWGALFSGGPSPDRLQVVHVPIINPQQCLDANSTQFDIIENFDTQICAAVPEGGIDTCQGDSGGPLLVRSQDNTKWFHAGATSYGAGCAFPNLPGLYARTSVLSSWVEETAALPSRSYAVTITDTSVLENINFGNVSTIRPFVETIEPRWQLTNLSASVSNPTPGDPITFNWNILDEGTSTFSCQLDADGSEAGSSITVPCAEGANSYTTPAGYSEGIYLPTLAVSKGTLTQNRQPLVVVGDPESDSASGVLTILDNVDPDYEDTYYIDYYELDLSGVPAGRAVGLILEPDPDTFSPFLGLYDADERDPIAGGGQIRQGARTLVFVADPTINYLVGVSTQNAEDVGGYTLTTTEGTLTPTTP